MRIQNVIHLVGQVLLILAGFMLLPFVYGLIFHYDLYWSFVISAALTAIGGGVLYYYGRVSTSFSLRDGFLVVGSSWVLASFFSALPFYLSQTIPGFIDALFESVSGMTATGASIVDNIDAMPKAFILWRSLTNWLGGMGMIVLVLAFLKNLGADAAHLFQAEASVPRPGVVLPRIRSIAGNLWRIYLGFTVVCCLLLWLGGIDFFNALNLTFATIATGGFTPQSGGTFNYASNYFICCILIVFMILAGGNFTVYQSVMQRGLKAVWQDFEFRVYLITLGIGTSLILIALIIQDHRLQGHIVKDSLFSLVSMQTGSGFAIIDYNQWPHMAQMTLFISTFFGGCSGSTTGGIKIIRLIILSKSSLMYLRKAIHPDMVQMVRIGGHPLPNKWLQVTQQFFFLYMLIFGISALLLSSTGISFGESIACVAGILGNVGLAFGALGPTESFNVLSPFAKVVCIMDMLLGRLEIFTLLVLLHPGFWQGYFTKSNNRRVQRSSLGHERILPRRVND